MFWTWNCCENSWRKSTLYFSLIKYKVHDERWKSPRGNQEHTLFSLQIDYFPRLFIWNCQTVIISRDLHDNVGWTKAIIKQWFSPSNVAKLHQPLFCPFRKITVRMLICFQSNFIRKFENHVIIIWKFRLLAIQFYRLLFYEK